MFWYLLLGVFFVMPFYAHAYLDPGSGSYLVQMIIAFAAGGLFFIRSQLARLYDFVRHKIFRVPQKTAKAPEEKHVSSAGK